MVRHGWRAARAVTAMTTVMVVLACGSSGGHPSAVGAASSAPVVLPSSGTGMVQMGDRQVTVHVPDSYDPARPAALVIALHGYTSNATELETYFRLTPESDRRGFVYVAPDGLTDDQGEQFWNATDACCAFAKEKPDDSRFLSDLITTVENTYRIDRARVYLIGHSNGAFMALRMACDHADQVTAVVSVNGAGWNDGSRCQPSRPVSVLAIHSSTDEVIAFNGGAIHDVTYPSAATTVDQWLGHDKCATTGRDAPSLDLVGNLAGAETSVRTYTQGCAGGSTVESWTINRGLHVPQLVSTFAPAVTKFMFSQVKPAA